MRKLLVLISLIVAASLFHLGISAHGQAMAMRADKLALEDNNALKTQEIEYKRSLKQTKPLEMSKAFNFLVNQMGFLETYTGTTMDIVFSQGKDRDSLENYYKKTEFRGVNGLPLIISINKFSKETEVGSVLNAVYLLEKRTDFKVTEISKEDANLTVKGELYGI